MDTSLGTSTLSLDSATNIYWGIRNDQTQDLSVPEQIYIKKAENRHTSHNCIVTTIVYDFPIVSSTSGCDLSISYAGTSGDYDVYDIDYTGQTELYCETEISFVLNARVDDSSGAIVQ